MNAETEQRVPKAKLGYFFGVPKPKPGYCFEDLKIGDTFIRTRKITEEDLIHFAHASGDWNPLHFDEEYAKTTIFKERVVHGMLTESIFSGMLGMELPGPGTILVSKSVIFKRPVRIGDTVQAMITVKELTADRRGGKVVLEGKCTVAGKTVLEGEVVVLVPTKK